LGFVAHALVCNQQSRSDCLAAILVERQMVGVQLYPDSNCPLAARAIYGASCASGGLRQSVLQS
jgi:hypothetical protein